MGRLAGFSGRETARVAALHGGQFIRCDMPGVIAALLPALEFLMPARGMRREFSPLHGGAGGDLCQQMTFLGWIPVCLAS